MTAIATERDALIEQNPDLVQCARGYYDETMPYHNYEGHILSVWEEARRLSQYCIEHGLQVNVPVIDWASNFHDANVHRPLIARYTTPERWSGAIAVREMSKRGFAKPDTELVRRAIIETTHGVQATTLEGAILKRADISNVGDTYVGFIHKSIAVFYEALRRDGLHETPDAFERWRKGACWFLNGHLEGVEPFGDFDSTLDVPRSTRIFKRTGLENIARLSTETIETIKERLGITPAE